MANSKESCKQCINSEMQVPKPSLKSQFCQMQSDLVNNFLIVYNLHLKIRTEASDCEIEQDKILHLREQWITLDHSSSSALVPFYKVIDEKYESVKAAIKNVKEKMEPYLGVLKSYFGEIVQDELPRSEINKMSPDRLKGTMKQFEAKIEVVAELKSFFLDFKQEWDNIKLKLDVDIQYCFQRLTTLL